MSVYQKDKGTERDWASWGMLTIMGVLVAGALLFAWKVYQDYEEAFHGTPPTTADERIRSVGSGSIGKQGLASIDARAAARAEWGQLGDYFGGTLNPVFGFASLMALLFTVVFQARELRQSTKELKNSAQALRAQNKAIEQQNFEQTFFAWHQTYRVLLTSVEHQQWKGREALKVLFDVRLSMRVLTQGAVSTTSSANVINAWNRLFEEKEYQFDGLFRNLYRLLLWIHAQPPAHLTTAQKWFYVSLVRGQLSQIELIYLFLNGLMERGAKFKRLAETYALFDNLNLESDPVLSVIRDAPEGPLGYVEAAYSSVAARKALGLPESAEEALALATCPPISPLH